jgi:hypothetical protein
MKNWQPLVLGPEFCFGEEDVSDDVHVREKRMQPGSLPRNDHRRGLIAVKDRIMSKLSRK